MSHIPYGYKIVNGKAEIVRQLFDGYIAGLGLQSAAKAAGLDVFHGSAGRMLRNTHYLGDAYYPAIIDKERFEKAEEIRISRAVSLGRVKEWKVSPKHVVDIRFTIPFIEKQFLDPFAQAEYAYRLIESEVEILE